MKTVESLQIELCGYAIDIAKGFGFSLDYSNHSIKHVETILGYIHEDYMKDKNEEGLNGVALEFAFYIGTVIQRVYNVGCFEKDHEEFGENSYPYYINGGSIFPHAWCYKRIFDGPQDNVWSKYSILVIDKLEPKSKKKSGFAKMLKKFFKVE